MRGSRIEGVRNRARCRHLRGVRRRLRRTEFDESLETATVQLGGRHLSLWWTMRGRGARSTVRI
jgi:hypothetical protein